MMRILVTGVTGQVGGALVEALRPAGAVVAADRAALDLARLEEIAAAGARRAAWVLLRLPYQVKDLFLDWLKRSVHPDRAARQMVR